MKSKGLIWVVAGVLLLCLCVSGVSATGCTPGICNTNTGLNYITIQDAINAATSGNIITVDGPSGSSYAPFIVDKKLTLQGLNINYGLPMVVSQDSTPAISIGTGVTGVTLDSFTLDEASGPSGSGVYIPAGSSGNTLKNIAVNGFLSGIYIDGSNNNVIDTCNLTGGTAGIYLYGNSNSVTKTTLSAMNSYGLVIGSPAIPGTNNIIHDNTFTGMPNNVAAISVWGPSNTIDSNIFTNNYLGIITYNPPSNPTAQGINNLIYNNKFQASPVNNIGDTTNVWNITKTPGTNIIGGPYIGGNYWASPNQDFSLTCTNEGDGICNSVFTDSDMSIVDNYPLTSNAVQSEPGTIIEKGATVFIGEGGLDVTHALNAAQGLPPDGIPTLTTIGWWASAADVQITDPTRSTNLNGIYSSFLVDPLVFGGYTGSWYVVGSGGHGMTPPIFNVSDPSLGIATWDIDHSIDVNGKSVLQSTRLRFRIDTNMYPAVDSIYRSPLNPTTDGYINIKVKDQDGAVLTRLYNNNIGTPTAGPNSILANYVDAPTWYWGESGSWSWNTGAVDGASNFLYPAGTYTVWAESTLHGMKENYKNGGADYTGKTVSEVYTVTLVSSSGASPVLTHQQAIDYGVTNYLGGITQGNGKQELLVSDIPVPAGTVITLLDGSTITSPANHPTWLVFINEDKNANWGHASKYAFIYDSTVIQATPIMFPPTGIALSHASGKVPNPAGLTSIMPPFIKDPACTPVTTNNYALLISGGGTKETNYARYYNDIKFMYNTLVNDYKYNPNSIIVLMSDGPSNSAADQLGSYTGTTPNYIDSNPDLNGDGKPEVNDAATSATVIGWLSKAPLSTLKTTDNLLIFTTGHGAVDSTNTNTGDPNNNAVDLLLWGAGEKILDKNFVAALPKNPKISMMMEQCNGGGFKDNFFPTGYLGSTRILATAATGAQSSHSNDFSYYWITGVAGHDSASPANPANADTDSNGQVSMTEGYTYANKWDPSGPNWAYVETPTFSEYATGAGATQFFSTCAAPTQTITVTSPTAGVTWTKANKYTVTWNSANLPTSPATYVKVELREGSGQGYWQTDINKSVLASAGSGGVSWTVPAALPAGPVSDYWVKISTIGSISPPIIGQSPMFTISGVTKSATASLTVNALPSAISTGSEIVIKDSSGNTAKIGGVEQTGKKTPYTFTGLTSDTYTITVSSSCYYSSTTSVKLLPQASQTKTLTLLGPITACGNGVPYGSIAVTSVPEEGYEVFLDGKDMGYGTPVIQDIDAGSHTVRLEASGYQSQSKSVTVTAGGQARADFALIPQIPEVTANVLIVPQPLNIGRTGYFVAFVKLPTGNKAADVIDGSVSCEGAPALKLIRVKLFPQVFAAIFKRQDLHTVQPGNKVPMSVVGTIKKSGGNVLFRGTANVNVISKKVTTREDVDNVMTLPDTQIFTKFNKF